MGLHCILIKEVVVCCYCLWASMEHTVINEIWFMVLDYIFEVLWVIKYNLRLARSILYLETIKAFAIIYELLQVMEISIHGIEWRLRRFPKFASSYTFNYVSFENIKLKISRFLFQRKTAVNLNWYQIYVIKLFL